MSSGFADFPEKVLLSTKTYVFIMNAYHKFKDFMTGPEPITLAVFGILTILSILLLIKVSL